MKIIVTPDDLNRVAQEIETLSGDYAKEYSALFSDVDAMKSAWKGKDNTAFVTKIEGFRTLYEAMKKEMDEYAAFLRDTATKYTTTQSAVIEGAQKLFNGTN